MAVITRGALLLLFSLSALQGSYPQVSTEATNVQSTELSPYLNLSDYICSTRKQRYFNGMVSCYYSSGGDVAVRVAPITCLTYDDRKKGIVAGKCIQANRTKYQTIQSNITVMDLQNGATCENGYTGTLCGACDNNSTAAINTYGLMCIPRTTCSDASWVLYFVETLIPLTVFFCVILALRIRVTTGSANSFVLYAQVVTLPINVVLLKRDWALVTKSEVAEALTNLFATLYGIWNLDFLRGTFPEICTKQHLGALQLFAIEYVTAVYPLILIVISYIVIELHARNFRPVVICWKPFSKCLALLGRPHPNARRSVVDAFATFLLLSYAKFAHTSLAILAPTPLYNLQNDEVGKVWLYDGNVPYFQPPHTYYASAAIVVLIVFVIPPPLLLFLYPMRFCQRCLDVCRLRSNLLTAFTDAYLGCFKDGLDETKDCRFFAGTYFVVRVSLFALFAFIADYYLLHLLVQIVVTVVLILLVIYRPYKNDFFNKLDMLLSSIYILITGIAVHNANLIANEQENVVYQTFFYIILMIPLVYATAYSFLSLLIRLCNRYLSKRQGRNQPPSSLVTFFSNSVVPQEDTLTTPMSNFHEFPDRLLQPEDYEPQQ